MEDIQDLKDRIAELEETVHQSIWTIEFLHGCLTEPEHYKYEYPHQTLRYLEEASVLAPPPQGCWHSGMNAGCQSCTDRINRVQAKIDREKRKHKKGLPHEHQYRSNKYCNVCGDLDEKDWIGRAAIERDRST